MDPNKLLEEIRESLAALDHTDEDADRQRLAIEVCDKFEQLDEWLSGGGFMPHDWLLAVGRSRNA